MVSTLSLVALVCLATLAEAGGQCGEGGKRAGTHCVCALSHTCRGPMCTYARSGKRTLRSGDDQTSTVVKARSGFSMSKCADCSCVADRAKTPLPTPGPSGTYVPGSDGTYAQNYQDVWFETIMKKNGWHTRPGFYLDLGAFHPLRCSNTAMLDIHYGWSGVCVEPRPEIDFSVRSCVLVNRPMTGTSGVEVQMGGSRDGQIFNIGRQAREGNGEIGLTIKTINAPDLLRCVDTRTGGEEVDGCEGVHGTVEVPKFIEFVSMDVEDNEYSTLVTWPWDEVKVAVWIIENLKESPTHKQVQDIMIEHGYIWAQVEAMGVDNYFVLPEYWDDALVRHDRRKHPEHSHGC